MMSDDPNAAVPARIARVEDQLTALSASVDARFDAIDKRFDAVDKRFDNVDEALVEQRRYTEFAFERLTVEMRGGFDRLERKLDRFIDTQSTTNELVDRRLRALEERGRS